MASQNEIPAGEDSRKNWRVINELMRRVTKLEGLVSNHGSSIQDLRGRPDIKGSGGGGDKFMGEYNALLVYTPGQSVKISAGITAGFYIKTATSIAGKHPSEGEVWAKLGNVIDEENWL